MQMQDYAKTMGDTYPLAAIMRGFSPVEADRTMRQSQADLRPTVEVLKETAKRTTTWGWRCSCGDCEMPRNGRSRSAVLDEARSHFDTKHGGVH